MAKTLAKVAMIAGAVALVATGVGAAAGAGLFGAAGVGAAGTVAGVSVATISTVAQVATVVAAAASLGAQLMAKKPGLQGAVNSVTISANAAVPYGVGRSFYGGSQLADVGWGAKVNKTKNPILSKVFVWSAGGPVEEIESFLVDWQPVPFFGTAASGYYGGWLWSDNQLGQRPEPDALAPPVGLWGSMMPDWGSDYKLSGYAASLISFKFDRDNKVWANGIPAFGVVGKWARVYDPRKDSTYPGGEGAHRFGDEDTFEFDRNAALNAITYARGRYAIDTTTGEQTVKVVGCGFPQEAFDWPQWVAFANICEANGWNSDGTVYDGPGISLWDNLKRICAAGGAVPVISGGLLSVRFQSPKVALDTITPDDFADGERIVPGMRTYRDRINTMVPKYRSEANKWEYVQSEAVSFESYIALDGERKEEEYTCELVTDKDQAAQLTAYELFNRRELSGITIPCKPRLWEVRLGEAYQVIDPETGLNHLCVIAAISKDLSTGIVTLTFETEDTAKHALALAMTGTAPPPPTLVPPGDADDASWDNGGSAVDAVTEMNVIPSEGAATVTWRNPTNARFAYSRVYRGTSNVFSAASEIAGPVVGGLGQVQAVDDELAAGTYFWWVRAFDNNDAGAEPTGPFLANVALDAGGNLLTAPNDFTAWYLENGGGGASNPVVTPDFDDGPIGLGNADRIQFARGSSFSRAKLAFPTVAGHNYRFSIWLKAPVAGPSIALMMVGNNSGTLSLATGWQRFSVTVTATGSTTDAELILWGAISGAPAAADLCAAYPQVQEI